MSPPAIVHIEREQDSGMSVVAWGVLLSRGRIVVEWRPEAFPEGERTDEPTLSIYGTLADAEEATGGKVVIHEEQEATSDAISKAISRIAAEKETVEELYPQDGSPESTEDAQARGKCRGLTTALDILNEERPVGGGRV